MNKKGNILPAEVVTARPLEKAPSRWQSKVIVTESELSNSQSVLLRDVRIVFFSMPFSNRRY